MLKCLLVKCSRDEVEVRDVQDGDPRIQTQTCYLFFMKYFTALSRKEESLLQLGGACRAQGLRLRLQSQESQTAQHEDGKICDVINTSFFFALNKF